MTKTATITCEFEYELCIGQLTQRDAKLAEEVFGYSCADTNKFYKVAQEFHGEIIPESELDRIANLIKDSLHGKLKASLPRHFASNGGAKIVNIVMTEFSYKDGLCVRPRVQRVFANEDSDWDEDTDILVNIFEAAGWEAESPDVWFDVNFNDHDFDLRR